MMYLKNSALARAKQDLVGFIKACTGEGGR
jgi:hypothetical protein